MLSKRLRIRRSGNWLVAVSVLILVGCPDEPESVPGIGPGEQAPPPGPALKGEQLDPGAGAPGNAGDAGGPSMGKAPDDTHAGSPGVALAAEDDGGKAGSVDHETLDTSGVRRIDEIPPEAKKQEKLNGSNSITVSGKLKGKGCKGKTVRIEALTFSRKTKPPLQVATVKIQKGIGSFTMKVPKSKLDTYINASCDGDGDGFVTIGPDYSAVYAKNPVTPNANISNVVLEFTTEPITEGMPPDVGDWKKNAPPGALKDD